MEYIEKIMALNPSYEVRIWRGSDYWGVDVYSSNEPIAKPVLFESTRSQSLEHALQSYYEKLAGSGSCSCGSSHAP